MVILSLLKHGKVTRNSIVIFLQKFLIINTLSLKNKT
jgi:hypothetical protein